MELKYKKKLSSQFIEIETDEVILKLDFTIDVKFRKFAYNDTIYTIEDDYLDLSKLVMFYFVRKTFSK